MNIEILHRKAPTDARPAGVIQPANEPAARVLAALEQRRLAEAEKRVDTVPDSPMLERAWKLLLRGLVAVERLKAAEAEPLFQEAACLGFVSGLGSEGSVDAEALRVAARCLHHLGRIYRRRERPDDAYSTHLSAYHLRKQHGSLEELWETSAELGLDADVGRRYDDARRWHRLSIEFAEKASQQPHRSQAVAWSNLCTSCTEAGRHEEAVAAARTARDCWRRHDITAVSAAHADSKLAVALLEHGQTLHERGDSLAGPVLDEAAEWLTAARDALLAFGPDHAAEARLCLERKDFAQRLLASLDP